MVAERYGLDYIIFYGSHIFLRFSGFDPLTRPIRCGIIDKGSKHVKSFRNTYRRTMGM